MTIWRYAVDIGTVMGALGTASSPHGTLRHLCNIDACGWKEGGGG